MKLSATRRGLLTADFTDRYGKHCSVQESSFADEPCIWLGVDSDANDDLVENGRMHLTKTMVKELLPILRYFVKHGSLGEEGPQDQFKVGSWVLGVDSSNFGVEGRVIHSMPGVSITVQDFRKPGVDGQHSTVWDCVSEVWEPAETPTEIPTWFDHLDEDL